jgi:hypothetical protein
MLYKLRQVKDAIFVFKYVKRCIFCCTALQYRHINDALTTPVGSWCLRVASDHGTGEIAAAEGNVHDRGAIALAWMAKFAGLPCSTVSRACVFATKRRLGLLSATGLKPAHQCSSPHHTGHDFFSTGTGTPATFTLKEPRLVRVQKYTVFQSSPPNATLAVFAKPWTTRPSFLPIESRM